MDSVCVCVRLQMCRPVALWDILVLLACSFAGLSIVGHFRLMTLFMINVFLCVLAWMHTRANVRYVLMSVV